MRKPPLWTRCWLRLDMHTAPPHLHSTTSPSGPFSVWITVQNRKLNLQHDHIHFNSVLKQQQLQQQKTLQYSTQRGLLLSSSVPVFWRLGHFYVLLLKRKPVPGLRSVFGSKSLPPFFPERRAGSASRLTQSTMETGVRREVRGHCKNSNRSKIRRPWV